MMPSQGGVREVRLLMVADGVANEVPESLVLRPTIPTYTVFIVADAGTPPRTAPARVSRYNGANASGRARLFDGEIHRRNISLSVLVVVPSSNAVRACQTV